MRRRLKFRLEVSHRFRGDVPENRDSPAKQAEYSFWSSFRCFERPNRLAFPMLERSKKESR